MNNTDHSAWRNKILRLTAALFALGYTYGCVTLGPVTDSVDQAVQAVDTAISTIQGESGAWRDALARLEQDLPRAVSQSIRTEVQQLVERSAAVAGIQFRCNVDFLGNRAIQALQRLRAELLGAAQPPLPPSFCSASPAHLDLNAEAERRSTLYFDGYDLDQKDSQNARFKVVIEAGDGALYELPENLIGRTTHYQAVVNLADQRVSNVLFRKSAKKIRVAWNGRFDAFPEVVVVPWMPRRVSRYSQDLGHITHYPPKTGGDKDFFITYNLLPPFSPSSGVSVTVKAETAVREGALKLRAYMKAVECDLNGNAKGDKSTAEGWSNWQNGFTPEPGYEIRNVKTGTTTWSGIMTEKSSKTVSRAADEVASKFVIYADHEGDDIGTYTRVEAHFSRLDVELESLPPAEFAPDRDVTPLRRFTPR